jgi:hypothetical protein
MTLRKIANWIVYGKYASEIDEVVKYRLDKKLDTEKKKLMGDKMFRHARVDKLLEEACNVDYMYFHTRCRQITMEASQ